VKDESVVDIPIGKDKNSGLLLNNHKEFVNNESEFPLSPKVPDQQPVFGRKTRKV
jgi:hypothetical protein